MRRNPLSASVLLALVAACAPARQDTLTSIPVPLASALIADRAASTNPTATYSVGAVPAGYPAGLVPAGPTRIVGGMTKGGEIVAIFADSTRRLAAVMEQLFEQHGYMRPPPTSGAGFSPGSGPYSYFCSDSAMVSVEPLAGESRSFARVSYRARGAGYCRRSEPTRSTDQLALPELKPPAGVHVSRSHGGSGSDDVRSTAEMTGANLNAPAIVAHYAAQLVAAGWTADPPATGQRVAAQYFEAKDTSGAFWEGVLMASGSKTGLIVSLSMHPRVSR